MKVLHERRISSSGTVGGLTLFEMTTDEEPTAEDVVEAQIRLGYHPGGYSGPWDVKSVENSADWRTTWSCSGSCD